MKLQAEINGEKHDVEITRNGDIVRATVDGRSYELEASEPEHNVFLLKNNGRIFEADVSVAAGKPHQVRVGSEEFEIKLIDPKRLRGSAGSEDAVDGTAEIKTAMPGKVVRIIAAAGTVVQKGDGIIVVEAMKMQNEMRSPKDGVVREIRAAEGSTVNAGEILAVIE
jgi:biotin carboxyl carrier protein